MERQEFVKLADRCLQKLADRLEDFDPDELDFSTGDGLLELEFGDGVRFVLNRQSGNHQMWLAAGARAWHFDWDPERELWLDDRDGRELFARLSEVVSEKLGKTVGLG